MLSTFSKTRQVLLIALAALSLTFLLWSRIQPIQEDDGIRTLRIAVVEHTPYHDGSSILWLHYMLADERIEVIGGVLAALSNVGAQYDLYRMYPLPMFTSLI
jgi:hypothetical protein